MFKLFKRNKKDAYTEKLDRWLAENQLQREQAMKEIERISNILIKLNNMEDIEND